MSAIAGVLRPGARPAARSLAWAAAASFAGVVLLVLGLAQLVVMASAAAAVMGWLAVRRPVALLAGLLLLLGFSGTLRANGFPVPDQSLVPLAALGVMVGTAVALLDARRHAAVRPWPSLLLLAGYVVFAFLLISDAPDLRPAVTSFQRTFVPFVLLLALAIIPWPWAVRERVLRALVWVGTLVAAYAAFRYFVGASDAELAIAGRSVDIGAGELATIGSFTSRQDLGGWIAVMLPLLLAAALSYRDATRGVALVGSACSGIALFGANTRVATIGGVIAVVLLIGLLIASRSSTGRLGLLSFVVVAATAFGVIAFTLIISGNEGTENRDRYARILDPSRDIQLSQRREKWKVAIRETDGKLLGNGLGTAGSAQIEMGRFARIENSFIDNGYLTVAYQLGFASTALLLLSLLGVLYGLVKAALGAVDPRRASLAAAAAASIVAWLIMQTAANFFERSAAAALCVIVGLAVGAFVSRDPRDGRA